MCEIKVMEARDSVLAMKNKVIQFRKDVRTGKLRLPFNHEISEELAKRIDEYCDRNYIEDIVA